VNCQCASAVYCCVLQLLEKSPQKRLRSVESLQRLPYFRDVNFDGLYHQQVAFVVVIWQFYCRENFYCVECLCLSKTYFLVGKYLRKAFRFLILFIYDYFQNVYLNLINAMLSLLLPFTRRHLYKHRTFNY